MTGERCNQATCDRAATWRAFWPGQSVTMCDEHYIHACGIADAMGLVLEGQRLGELHMFKPLVDGVCVFCGGTFLAGFTDGTPAVFHTMPPCARFLALEPPDFLQAVRELREREGQS